MLQLQRSRQLSGWYYIVVNRALCSHEDQSFGVFWPLHILKLGMNQRYMYMPSSYLQFITDTKQTKMIGTEIMTFMRIFITQI